MNCVKTQKLKDKTNNKLNATLFKSSVSRRGRGGGCMHERHRYSSKDIISFNKSPFND